MAIGGNNIRLFNYCNLRFNFLPIIINKAAALMAAQRREYRFNYTQATFKFTSAPTFIPHDSKAVFTVMYARCGLLFSSLR